MDDLRMLGFTLGIITSKSKSELCMDFERLKIGESFDLCVTADDTLLHKPDPAPMTAYLQKAKVEPSDVLYVGDTIYDFLCAAGAGVDFALAMWGAKSPDGIPARFRPLRVLSLIDFLH